MAGGRAGLGVAGRQGFQVDVEGLRDGNGEEGLARGSARRGLMSQAQQRGRGGLPSAPAGGGDGGGLDVWVGGIDGRHDGGNGVGDARLGEQRDGLRDSWIAGRSGEERKQGVHDPWPRHGASKRDRLGRDGGPGAGRAEELGNGVVGAGRTHLGEGAEEVGADGWGGLAGEAFQKERRAVGGREVAEDVGGHGAEGRGWIGGGGVEGAKDIGGAGPRDGPGRGREAEGVIGPPFSIPWGRLVMEGGEGSQGGAADGFALGVVGDDGRQGTHEGGGEGVAEGMDDLFPDAGDGMGQCGGHGRPSLGVAKADLVQGAEDGMADEQVVGVEREDQVGNRRGVADAPEGDGGLEADGGGRGTPQDVERGDAGLGMEALAEEAKGLPCEGGVGGTGGREDVGQGGAGFVDGVEGPQGMDAGLGGEARVAEDGEQWWHGVGALAREETLGGEADGMDGVAEGLGQFGDGGEDGLPDAMGDMPGGKGWVGCGGSRSSFQSLPATACSLLSRCCQSQT